MDIIAGQTIDVSGAAIPPLYGAYTNPGTAHHRTHAVRSTQQDHGKKRALIVELITAQQRFTTNTAARKRQGAEDNTGRAHIHTGAVQMLRE